MPLADRSASLLLNEGGSLVRMTDTSKDSVQEPLARDYAWGYHAVANQQRCLVSMTQVEALSSHALGKDLCSSERYSYVSAVQLSEQLYKYEVECPVRWTSCQGPRILVLCPMLVSFLSVYASVLDHETVLFGARKGGSKVNTAVNSRDMLKVTVFISELEILKAGSNQVRVSTTFNSGACVGFGKLLTDLNVLKTQQ
jgi:hypothetical protein